MPEELSRRAERGNSAPGCAARWRVGRLAAQVHVTLPDVGENRPGTGLAVELRAQLEGKAGGGLARKSTSRFLPFQK